MGCLSDEERKAKIKASQHKYYSSSPKWRKRKEENKEKANKRASLWRVDNPEKVKANQAAWNAVNKDKKRISDLLYRKNNPDRVKATLHNKRARKKYNGGKLSPDVSSRLFVLQKGKCAICRKSLRRVGFHIDHIIPLVRGGKNEDKNVQLSCPKCNIKKGGKDPIQFMQSLGYLL